MKRCLLDFSLAELKNLILELGEKPFRAGQIFKSLHHGLKFSEMTDLSLFFREKLAEQFIGVPLEIIKTLKSADGTEKFLYALSDGNVIEGVVMKYKYGATLCVSTQVGCRMGCAFCASFAKKSIIFDMPFGQTKGYFYLLWTRNGYGNYFYSLFLSRLMRSLLARR